jgi:hypothetical protein
MYNKMSDEGDSVEERVINKVQKIITVKKILTPKQQLHIDNLAIKKKGTKYTKQVDVEEVEIPTEIKESKGRKVKKVVESVSESSEEIVIKKKPKKQKKIRYIEESEDSTQEIIVKKPKAKAINKAKAIDKAKPKPKPKPKAKAIDKEEQPVQPLFNKKLF